MLESMAVKLIATAMFNINLLFLSCKFISSVFYLLICGKCCHFSDVLVSSSLL